MVFGVEVLCDEPRIWGVSTSREMAETVYFKAQKDLKKAVQQRNTRDGRRALLTQDIWNGIGKEGYHPPEYAENLPKGSCVLALSHTAMEFPHWVHVILAEIPVTSDNKNNKRKRIK